MFQSLISSRIYPSAANSLSRIASRNSQFPSPSTLFNYLPTQTTLFKSIPLFNASLALYHTLPSSSPPVSLHSPLRDPNPAPKPTLTTTITRFFSRQDPRRRKNEEYNDDEGPDLPRYRKPKDNEKEELKRQKEFLREEKKQFYRSNDGMWLPAKAQVHRAEVVKDHYRAEETYQINEYNDYLRELTATRRVNILEHKDKKMMGELSDEEMEEIRENPLPSNKLQHKMDKELAKVQTEKEKEVIYRKYAQEQEDEVTKRMVWMSIIIVLVFMIPWDSRNPDLPF